MKIKRPKDNPAVKPQPNHLSKVKVVKENSVLPSKERREENDFPLKRFKGTKWIGGEANITERKNKFQTMNSKGVVDFTDESESKSNKTQNHESYDFMSKLELFSDVWNDCPNVKNPKENDESWHSKSSKAPIGNKIEDYNRTCNKVKTKNEFDGAGWNTTFSNNVSNEKEKRNNRQMEIEPKKQKLSQEENLKQFKLFNHSPNIQQGTENHDSNISDLKRKKAVQEHSQLHNDKKNIIKKALSSTDGKDRPNKKIVFDDAEELVENKVNNGAAPEEKGKLRQQLFEDNSSDVETDFKLNHQFKGKKGQKLLELQSKFASDSRFALDTRFYESGSEEAEESEKEPTENLDHENEKMRQLEILESIVKQPIKPLSEIRRKKPVFSDETYLRFDPTREEHKKYIITQPDTKKQTEAGSEKMVKKKKKNELEALTKVEANKTKVTTEKFVAVKEDFKEALKKDGGAEFSLLKLFGPKESDEVSAKGDESQTPKKLKYATRNPFKYDSSESEPEEEESKAVGKKKAVKKEATAQTKASWRTTFFLSDSDPRLAEAFEFLKCPEEPENNKEYAEKRKVLKDFIRHKFKNSNRKNSLFKKKLGGFKKKGFQKKKAKSN